MRESGSPLGEARRLRYFVLISSKLLESQSVDMDLFIEKLVKAAEIINPDLKNYIRDTGVLQSNAVARNYLRFADWLGFLRIENRIVTPTGYTVFLANLDGKKGFFLTEKEKIVFFLRLIDLKDFQNLICHLKVENSIKEYVDRLDLSEHFIESYFEWLVDFGILKPTKRRFGSFSLANLGYQVREALKQKDQIQTKYAGLILGTNLSNTLQISDDDVWRLMNQAVNKLGLYTRSEVDNSLYSAYPLVLETRIQLILEYHIVLPMSELLKKLKGIAANHNALFSWDNMADSGYLKIMR